MVRLEFDQEFEDDFENYRPLKPKRRRKRRRRYRSIKYRLKKTCCFGFLFIFLMICLITVAAVAKTGIIEIPFISKIVYRFEQPEKVIEVDQDINGFRPNVKLSPDGQLLILEVSEQSLTMMLRQALASQPDPYFTKDLQAVISPEDVTITGFLLKPFRLNISLKVEPEVLDKKISFNIKRLTIGNLAMPPDLGNWLTNKFLGDKISELNEKIVKIGEIEDLELLEGKIVITGKFNLR